MIDGKTDFNKETLEDATKRYPGAIEVSLEEASIQIAKAAKLKYITDPIEIDEDQYMEMLEMLPPMNWIGGTFMLCEFSFDNYTKIFCKIGKRYFQFSDSASLKEAEIIQKVMKSSAFLSGN
jgi:hypothetical protein